MRLVAEYKTENGLSARILAVDEVEAVLEIDEVYPDFETRREVYVKQGEELFHRLSSGVEVGPLHEGLKPGSGYFIRSDLPAAETLAKTLGVKHFLGDKK